MSEQRRFILKTLTAGGLSLVAAPFGFALAQGRRAVERRVEPPMVAASSDLQPLLAEIVSGFEAQTQMKIRTVLGAEGRFYSQMLEGGAPFGMLLSADEKLIAQLPNTDKTARRSDVYAIGRLAFYVPSGSPLRADNFLGDIRVALRDGRLQRLAIADPQVDAYGRLAEEVLHRKQVGEEIQPLLAIGDSVAQAAQIAVGGNVQGALVAYSQASQLMAARGGKCMLVSDTLCAPLRARMVLFENADDATRLFYDYMLSDRARAVLRRYGYLIPAG
ncbi:MAG: molybdate ABC transporter substrate-binding protein [Burkholderiales bacterium]|jgi:molybdate transport system substrate-binding protein|nr:molybdate ABC transporter substrate-binding protein [Burkholderiales bacterium]